MATKARDFVARFLTDTSKFDTDEPIRGLDDLADAADTTARRMDDSFDRVKRSADDGLDRVATAGTSKARAAGAEIGDELAENMGEAFRSGDVGGLVTESLTSLAPALGAAGIGIGLGAALVGNMIKGLQDGKKRLAAATQSVIDNIDVDLTTFAAKFDVAQFLNDSIDALTEGGLVEDIAKFQKLASDTVGEDTLTRILAGTATAEDERAIRALVDEATSQQANLAARGKRVENDRQDAAVEVLRLLEQQNQAYEDGTNAVDTQIRAQQRLAGVLKTNVQLIDDQVRKSGRFAGKAGVNLPTDDR